MSGVPPAEGDLLFSKRDQAMGVAAEIVQHILGATEGTFQVDDPVLLKQGSEPSSEDLRLGEELPLFGEAELTRACRHRANRNF
jgi:hypothetical protein